MKLAYLTPLSPIKSGIASYSAMLLPELASRASVTVVVEQDQWNAPPGLSVISYGEYVQRRASFDTAIYHLGNNPHHEFIYREALEHPGVAVLHDLVLHHLIVEMTLARGDVEGYVTTLRENHGEAGAAWARGRAAGFHNELGNFLFPASRVVAERSSAVIVHNAYAVEALQRMGVTVPIHRINHPFAASPVGPEHRALLRSQHGFSDSQIVIGMFGFVTAAKRPGVVFESFAQALRRNGDIRLLIVGETAPDVDLDTLASGLEIPPHTWKSTGYVRDDEFDRYALAVDRVVSLRYPSAGETSGALLRLFHAGNPVAVSDYAQFGEYPEELTVRIPLGRDEVDSLSHFLSDPLIHSAAAQRKWLFENAGIEDAARGYLLAAMDRSRLVATPSQFENSIPIFPQLRFEHVTRRQNLVRLVLRNDDVAVLRAVAYGSPEYRLVVKIFAGGEEIGSQWLSLSRDVSSGESAEFHLVVEERATTLALHHRMEGIASVHGAPFAVVTVAA